MKYMRRLLMYFTLILLVNNSVAQELVEREKPTSTEESVSFGDEENATKDKKKKDKKDKDKKEDSITIDGQFGANLALNLVTLIAIIVFIYNRNYHKTELIFTFFAFNIVIFLLTYVMNHVKLSMGAAFGLFAVFSMLRYRTEGISPKDMTYLFIVIAVGLICAIKLDTISLAVVCLLLVLTTWLLDGNVIFKRQYSKLVRYDNIALIKPDKNQELIADLKQRTGLNIYKVTISKIDFLKDIAAVEVFYYD
ncbi:MAG: DUF4956 domain-containing protein [Cytophagales bacterium]